MSKPSKRAARPKHSPRKETNVAGEPVAVYARKAPRKTTPKPPKKAGYDAKRSSGMIPGIAKRMEEYLKTMRDGQ